MRVGKTALVVVALALAGATVADGHNKRYKTTTSYGVDQFRDNDVVGFVASKKKACVKNRKAKLVRVKRGRHRVVARDRTGRPAGSGDGHWVMEGRFARGKYYVKIVRKNVGRRGHKHICGAARTPKFRYPSGRPVG